MSSSQPALKGTDRNGRPHGWLAAWMARTAAQDGRRRSDPPGGASQALLLANAAGAAAATVFAVAGIARSGRPGNDDHPGAPEGFWAASSAIRTWAVAGPLLAAVAAQRRPAPQLLLAAGLVQLGDSALGLRQRNLPMTVAPATMGVIHLRTAYALTRHRRDTGA